MIPRMNAWMALTWMVAGAAMFLTFLWLITAGIRKSSTQRARENEEIRQAELRRARGQE